MHKSCSTAYGKLPAGTAALRLAALFSLASFLAACGGGSSNSTAALNPVPAVAGLSPSSTVAGAAPQTLTISGSNFLPTSVVSFNGASQAASFVSSSELTIQVSAAQQASAGNFPVVVTNPSPGGGASGPVEYTVNNPVPDITGLSPASINAGAAAQTLTIQGSGFVAGTSITLNNIAQAATFVSSTALTIQLTAADLATAGNFAVVATNPSPGGGASGGVNLTVNSGLQVTSTSPTSGATGVAVNGAITLQFNQLLSPGSLGAGTFSLTAGQQVYPVSASYDPANDAVSLTPEGLFAPGVTYTVTVAASLVSATGATLGSQYSWSFTAEQPVAGTATVSAPPGVDPTTLAVVNLDGTTASPTAAGTFSASVRPIGETLVAAMVPGENFGLMAIAISGESGTTQAAAVQANESRHVFRPAESASPAARVVYAKRLQVTGSRAAASVSTNLGLDFRTTAEALMFLSPPLEVNDPNQALPILTTIAANPDTQILAEALAAAWMEPDPISDPNVMAALHAAVQSTLLDLNAGGQAAAALARVRAAAAPSATSGNGITLTPNCVTQIGVGAAYTSGMPCLDLDFISLTPSLSGTTYTITASDCPNCATDWIGRVAPITEHQPTSGPAGIAAVAEPSGGSGSPVGPYSPDCTVAATSKQGSGCPPLISVLGKPWADALDVSGDVTSMVDAAIGQPSVPSAFFLPSQGGNSYVVRFYSGGFADESESQAVSDGDFTSGGTLEALALMENAADVEFNALSLVPSWPLSLLSPLQPGQTEGTLQCIEQKLAQNIGPLVSSVAAGESGPPADQIGNAVKAVATAAEPYVGSCEVSATAGALVGTLLDLWSNGFESALAKASNASALGQRILELTTRASAVETGVINIAGVAPPPPALQSLTVTCPKTSLQYGQPETCAASGTDTSGNLVAAPPVDWQVYPATSGTVGQSSSLSGQPTVDIEAGSVAGTIQVSAQAGKISSNTVAVSVAPDPPALLAVAPAGTTVQEGKQVQFTAEAFDSAGDVVPVSGLVWSSSDQAVATIDPTSGLAQAVAQGQTEIKAAAGSITKTVELKIALPAVARVDVGPIGDTLAPAQTLQYRADALDVAGNLVAGVVFSWQSSDPGVATVSSSGVVTAVAVGSAEITATVADGVAGSATVVVNPPPPPFVMSAAAVCQEGGPAIAITWVAAGAESYDLYRNGSVLVRGLLSPSFQDASGLTVGDALSYYVVAHLAGGSTIQSNTVSVTPEVCAVTITWTQPPPATIVAGQQFTIAWSIAGASTAPSSVTVQWDPSNPGSPSDPEGAIGSGCTALMDSCSAAASAGDTANLTAPTEDASGAPLAAAQTLTYVIHAVIGGTDYFSPPAQISSAGGTVAWQDNFRLDTALNTALWQTDSPLIGSAASAFASTLEPAQLSFDSQGMEMTGVNGYFQIAGIQSVQQLTPPFTVHVGVMGTAAVGNPFVLGLASTDLSQYMLLSGNLNSANNYYGMWIASSADSAFGTSLGAQLQPPTLASLDSEYSLVVNVDQSGDATVTGETATGTLFGASGSLHIGTGPFYLLLLQREGLPALAAGPNAAYWNSVSVADSGGYRGSANPSPAITTISPASALVGAAGQNVTITGTGFVPSSTVTFSGAAHPASYTSSTVLSVVLTAADLATAGTYPIVVVNPAPGGGASPPVDLTVENENPAPAITSLAPTSIAAGAGTQTLTINGSGFGAASTVSFNGTDHAATATSPTQISIELSAADLAIEGTYTVTVTNPAPGGGSASATLQVKTSPYSGFVVAPKLIGDGTVQSSDGRIDCSSSGGSATGTCTADYPAGASVTLTAAALSGWSFVQWSSASAPSCVGANPCTLNVTNANLAPTAQFQFGSITFTVLHTFAGAADGTCPTGVVESAKDVLYGTTASGGADNNGTIYEYDTTAGSFQSLHSFNGPADGDMPLGALTLGADGQTLYGTTETGGAYGRGTVFAFDPTTASLSEIEALGNGAGNGLNPQAGLVLASDGTLYGTARDGGTNGDGLIFSVSPNGAYTPLYSFAGGPDDGAQPYSTPLIGSDGALYVTTLSGGSSGNGAVVSLVPAAAKDSLTASFDGQGAFSGLVSGPNGLFYGVNNGGSGFGFAYSVGSATGLAHLHDFAGQPADVAQPAGALAIGQDGDLYGVADGGGGKGYGAVFQLDLAGHVSLIYPFGSPVASNSYPFQTGSLTLGADGAFYGTTCGGGANQAGMLFRVTVGGASTAAPTRH